MVEIVSRYVTKTKWSIPSSRIFLRRIFTIAKAKSTAIIAIKGFHSSQLFMSAIVLSTIRGRVRLLLSLSHGFLVLNNRPETDICRIK